MKNGKKFRSRERKTDLEMSERKLEGAQKG